MSRTIAALFDLDGVIVDTESQYSIYWNNVGAVSYTHLSMFLSLSFFNNVAILSKTSRFCT